MEFTHVYKSIIGGELQIGLPEKRISPTVSVPAGDGAHAISEIMEVAQRRMSSSQVSGSSWTFHKFISIVLRAATNTVLNSGIAFNRIGGKGHRANDVNNLILTEAEDADDDGIVADDEGKEEGNGEVEMEEFIDDAVVEDDVTMYREVDASEDIVGKEVFITPVTTPPDTYPPSDYLISEDEVLDLISGEDSDHGDLNPHKRPWKRLTIWWVLGYLKIRLKI